LALSLCAYSAQADVVWPAIILEQHLFSVIPIALGLLLELPVLLFGFGLPSIRAFIVDVCMNVVSALLGVILIPVAGLVWEIFPGLIMYSAFHMGTFNPITWGATYIIAVFTTTGVEATVVRAVFRLSVNRKRFCFLLGGNAASVGIVFVGLFIAPRGF
jgi:hypothetical protein